MAKQKPTCEKCHFRFTGECTENSPCALFQTKAQFVTFIKNLLRKGTFMWKSRSVAKNKAKVGPATYQCEDCGIYVYEGKKSLEKAMEVIDVPENITLIKGGTKLDHIKPIVDPSVGFSTWDSFVLGSFCFVNNFQVLCEDCHNSKTAIEKGVSKQRGKSEV